LLRLIEVGQERTATRLPEPASNPNGNEPRPGLERGIGKPPVVTGSGVTQ
jgi:hypothetical protein